MKTFFYIIQRDGQIFEVEFTEERFASSFEQWQKGGLIIFPFLGAGINAMDVSKILSSDQYQNYIDSALPRLFIKGGVWYDIKERKPVRYEKWKQQELDQKRQVLLPSPEKKGKEKKIDISKFRPDFMKEKDRIAKKMRVK